MPPDAVTLLPWLMLALLGLAALAAWLHRRNGSSNVPEEVVVEVGNRAHWCICDARGVDARGEPLRGRVALNRAWTEIWSARVNGH